MSCPYIIKVVGGSSHNFIASLIIQLITEDKNVISYSDIRGNAHSYYNIYSATYLNTIPKHSNPNPSYSYVTSKTSMAPVLLEYHPIDFDALKRLYPNFKYLSIIFREEDKLLMEFNHFYKNTRYGGCHDNEYWDIYISDESLNIRRGLQSLIELNEFEVKELLEANIKKYNFNVTENTKLWSMYKDQFPDNIFLINFKDILNNSEAVISVVEEMTGLSRTPELIASYESYLKIQKTFAEKHYSLLPK